MAENYYKNHPQECRHDERFVVGDEATCAWCETPVQQESKHPLSSFGHHRLPHRLWRISPRLFVVASAIRDICLIAAGRTTLHRAWQKGYDDGCVQAVARELRIKH